MLKQVSVPTRTEARVCEPACVSSRRVLAARPRRQEGRAPYAGSERSRVATGRADRPGDTEILRSTKSGSVHPQASAPCGQSMAAGRSAAPHLPRPDAICLRRSGAPSLVMRERTPVALQRQTEPARSLRLLHASDDRVGLRHDLVEAEPAVTVGFGLCFFQRSHESGPRCLLLQQTHTGRDHFRGVAIGAARDRFGRELLEIWWKSDAVHG